MNMNRTKNWFLERVGKRVYVKRRECVREDFRPGERCEECARYAIDGILINNEDDAEVHHFQHTRRGDSYFDTPQAY